MINVVETPILDTLVGTDGGYREIDISFCNIKEATYAARYFKKYNRYPFPPPQPKYEGDITYYLDFQQTAAYSDYKAFWDEEENRRRNGVILPGRLRKDGTLENIHITGHHYSYLNYSQILHDSKSSYDTGEEKVFKNKPKFARKVGKPEYNFPDFWDGDFHYYSALELAKKIGLNLVVDKTRQVGYSHKNSMLATDYYDLIPGSTVLLGAYIEDYLTTGDAIYNMARNKINFINANTDWKKTVVGTTGKGSKDEIISGYTYRTTKVSGGFNSKIIPATFRNNEGAARGKKSVLSLFDEAGKWQNLKSSLIATMKALKEGEVVTGIIIIFGTGGGDKETNFEDFEYIFYHPMEFDCLPFVNIWDNNMSHTVCGFFHPRWRNLKPYYDENGNSNKNAAIKSILAQREIWKGSGKEDVYKKNIAEEPICPSESFDASVDNVFTSPELIEWTNKVAHDTELQFGHNGKILLEDNCKLRFYHNNELKQEFQHDPITQLTWSATDDMHGCITIWDFPYRDSYGEIPEKMYYIVHDPYAMNAKGGVITNKHSMGAAYVYESINKFTVDSGDKIVAKLAGRPDDIDLYNEQLFKLAEYYGCTKRQLWFERVRGTEVKNYARLKKVTEYLCYETEVDSSKEIDVEKKVKDYGIDMTPGRIIAGIQYLRGWLYKPIGIGKDGKKKYNFHRIFDVWLLRQLLRYSLNGNFDAVSAVLILPFLERTLTLRGDIAESKGVNKNDLGLLNPKFLKEHLF